MGVLDFELETTAPPERVFFAATDFSERRPDHWPLISRKQYRVFLLGEHEAEVEEGTAPGHHRARYEWSEQDQVVRATTIDASGVRAGSLWELSASPRPGGGSIVRIHQELHFTWTRMGVMGRLLSLTGDRLFKRWLKQTLSILEAEPLTAGSDLAR
jgi:hypothetical protein